MRTVLAPSTQRGTPAHHEPLRRTLTRSLAIAGAAGAGLAVRRRDVALFLPVALLALWVALGGHYVERAFLDGARPRIASDRLTQAAARLAVWFVGGVVLYASMGAAARASSAPSLHLPWWGGGVAFVGVELVVHAVLAVRGLPNAYDGRG